ncbi:copine family protein 2-like isoform X2 [Phoenix dactylifera]|uniref:Copine family protein 2-like isoform X2 n=1 Tax=Phoenix dactylifera TaxID=42345 RepID=A0A8B7C0G2_PHODC|nr:copine family protein 2-like isoform X2 [Phoenix dactylifera]
METLPLIDVSSEDDLLISASSNAVPDPPSRGLSENHNENMIVSAEEGEGPVKMSKKLEQVLELSESPEQQRVNSRKYNLRKSLAWDNAFFTSEGVLNPEELAIVNSTFGKAEESSLPGIPEDIRKSTESTSTLDSDTLALENLEVELFENVRASIQKSLGKYENASNVVDSCKTKEHGELNAPFLASNTVELLSQNKKKPPIGMKRHVVTKKLSDHTSECPRSMKGATNKSADSKPSLKPPRVVSRTTLPTAPNKSGFGPGNIQPRSSIGKPFPGNLINRQSIIVPKKINGDSSIVTSNSVRSPRAIYGSPLVYPLSTSCSSHSGSVSSSSDSTGKSPSKTTRKRVASRITNHSPPGSTTKKTPVKASKIKTMSSNASNPPIHPKSTFKFSANMSPNSSLDSVASESSSSASITAKPGILRDSLDTGSLSFSPALAGPESIIVHSSGLRKLSAGHPYVGSENSATISHSQCISKGSSEIRVISEPSIGENSKRCTNNSSGTKSIKPSGLRKPTPKIGYFDAEKSLGRNVETFSQPGKLRNIIRSTGNRNPVGVNKPKPSKLQLIRPAAKNASTKCDPPRIQLTGPSSTHNMKPASPTYLQQLSEPSELGGTIRMTENHYSCSDVSKVLPPCLSEESHSKVSKVANGVVDTDEFGQFSNPSSGGQTCQEHSEFVTAFPIENESMMSNGKYGDCIGKVKTYEQPSCGYIKQSHMESDLHSVTRSIEKENLFPADETDGRSKDLLAKNLMLPMVESIEEKVSSLSLS